MNRAEPKVVQHSSACATTTRHTADSLDLFINMEVVVNVHAAWTTTSEQTQLPTSKKLLQQTLHRQQQLQNTHSHTAFQPVNMVEEDVNFL